jgi:hypothetical protein
LLMTRETVCVETPVIWAISLIVTLCWRGTLLWLCSLAGLWDGYALVPLW